MRSILFIFMFFFFASANAQYKTYDIGVKGDTLNALDTNNFKQGKWVNRYEEIRGEEGYEEEGVYKNNRKEGVWRLFSLHGDLSAIENYKWGNRDGKQLYYNMLGELVLEASYRAFNPEFPYDTIKVIDLNDPDKFEMKVIKVDGCSLKNGTWKYYDGGLITKTEEYEMDKLVTPKNDLAPVAKTPKKIDKPSTVQEYEKKNKNKKSVKYKDGSTGL